MFKRIRILENTGCFLKSNDSYYNMPTQQLIQTFLPCVYNYELVSPEEHADICLFSIGLDDKNKLRLTEVNILICIENCSRWYFYPHYNKYKEYGNDLVDIFIYNHISDIIIKEKSLSIPTVLLRIGYYLKVKETFSDILNCPFNKKRFCLVINRSGLNKDINKYVSILKNYGHVDNIRYFKLFNETCYYGLSLLKLFNQYKFILCFENSYQNGYITEKIFNCFTAKTIPIYMGAPDVNRFIDIDSFIDIRKGLNINIINSLNLNESLYNQIIHKPKIINNYTESYVFEMKKYINKN